MRHEFDSRRGRQKSQTFIKSRLKKRIMRSQQFYFCFRTFGAFGAGLDDALPESLALILA